TSAEKVSSCLEYAPRPMRDRAVTLGRLESSRRSIRSPDAIFGVGAFLFGGRLQPSRLVFQSTMIRLPREVAQWHCQRAELVDWKWLWSWLPWRLSLSACCPWPRKTQKPGSCGSMSALTRAEAVRGSIDSRWTLPRAT